MIRSPETDGNTRFKCGLSFCSSNCHRSNKLPPAILLKRLLHLHQHFIHFMNTNEPTMGRLLYILKITLDSTCRNKMDGFYIKNKVNINTACSGGQILLWKDWLCAMINCCISHARWEIVMGEHSFKYQNLHHSTLSPESRCSLA